MLASLIILGLASLFTANAVFEGTNSGLERSFIGSLTGNAALSLQSGAAFSLLGSEVPIVSEYEGIPAMVNHAGALAVLAGLPSLQSAASIVSAAAQLSVGGYAQAVPLFGIDPDSYFDVCSDISIDSGSVQQLQQGGVLINTVLARRIEQVLGRPLVAGEPITFSMYVGNTFRVRSAPFAGVHRYVSSTELLDRVVLADLVTVRSLANYTLGYGSEETAGSAPVEDLFNMDDLFSSNNDLAAAESPGIDLAALEAELAETAERDALALTDAGAWSFILLKAKEGQAAALQRELRHAFSAQPEFRVLSWRSAAGSTALAMFAVQMVFYIGLGFVAMGAVLVIMNALVISVLERSSEIGTMRSLGAPAGFIRGLFVAESMMLTTGAAVLGLLLGLLFVSLIQKAGFNLSNPLLVSLFGGSTLRLRITLFSALLHLALAMAVGALAWIYPVALAMRVQPLTAMNKG